MLLSFRKVMDALYLFCVAIAGTALVLISAVIPWAVYTRYVLNRAASWPEPAAVLLTIALTFIGAAACYRMRLHMNVTLVRDVMPVAWRRPIDVLAELLMGALCIFMVFWGAKLVDTTWYQSIGDFPFLSVGVTYLPIPIGGAFTLLFVIEHLLLGPPVEAGGDAHAPAAFD